MAGAKIFILYADGNGNVTISARDGAQGHIQPRHDEQLQAGVELLAGSGIVNGKLVANIRCEYAFILGKGNGCLYVLLTSEQQATPQHSQPPRTTRNLHSSQHG